MLETIISNYFKFWTSEPRMYTFLY